MSANQPLTAAVRSVLREAITAYDGAPETRAEAAQLRDLLDRIDAPLRVAIAGKVKAGKSTLLNALVGEEIAPTDAGECTRVVTWYRDGMTPRAQVYPLQGAPRQVPLRRSNGALALDLGAPAEKVERLVVDWPSQSLRPMTLIDTPGIGSLSQDVSARTHAFLSSEEAPSAADAVLYLMRHLHATDVRFLESFQDDAHARATPVNAIGVLSRADEIGAGRIDALQSAQRIARRYGSNPAVRQLCQTVVPVAGLLAAAGTTLRESEHALLAALATTPKKDTEALLLSADRFLSAPAPLEAEDRRLLLRRLGVFGVRLSVTLLRQGVEGAGELASQLVRRSGLEELRTVLSTHFAGRRDLLKARSALVTLDQILRRRPLPATAHLTGEVERIIAGAHEFSELSLLNTLRTGAVKFGKEELADAERLLGAEGVSLAARLGVERDASPDELRRAALDALGRWQRRAGSPLSSRAVADAARVVVRSCEGIIAALASPSATR